MDSTSKGTKATGSPLMPAGWNFAWIRKPETRNMAMENRNFLIGDTSSNGWFSIGSTCMRNGDDFAILDGFLDLFFFFGGGIAKSIPQSQWKMKDL